MQGMPLTMQTSGMRGLFMLPVTGSPVTTVAFLSIAVAMTNGSALEQLRKGVHQSRKLAQQI